MKRNDRGHMCVSSNSLMICWRTWRNIFSTIFVLKMITLLATPSRHLCASSLDEISSSSSSFNATLIIFFDSDQFPSRVVWQVSERISSYVKEFLTCLSFSSRVHSLRWNSSLTKRKNAGCPGRTFKWMRHAFVWTNLNGIDWETMSKLFKRLVNIFVKLDDVP